MTKHLVPFAGLVLAVAMLGLVPAQAPPGRGASEDEQAIRQAIAAYTAALNKGDAQQLLSLYAPDAEFIDETGKVVRGRDNLTALLRKQVKAALGQTVKIEVTGLRFLRPDVALEDGKAETTAADGASDTVRYSAVWVKTNGKWLISRVQDIADVGGGDYALSYSRLRDLEWVVGEWGAEGPLGSVALDCRWDKNRSYLIQEFTLKKTGEEATTVTQRIGYDPIAGQIRSWVFDSDGGFNDGFWTRQGNTWTAAVNGVLPDGRTGSATCIWKFVDDKSFVYRTVDRQIDGQPIADVEVKFVRKAK